MPPLLSNRTGSGNVPTINWDDEDSLKATLRQAADLSNAPKSDILKHGHRTYTTPLKLITRELKSRIDENIRDEATERLFLYRRILSKFQKEALEKVGRQSFPASSTKQKDELDLKTTLRLWGKIGLEFSIEQFNNARKVLVPFWKNTAYPAIHRATLRGAEAIRKALAPYIGEALENIRAELSYTKTSLRDTITDEFLDPTEKLRARIKDTPLPKKAGYISAAAAFGFVASTSLGNIPSQEATPPPSQPIAQAEKPIEAVNQNSKGYTAYEWHYTDARPSLARAIKRSSSYKINPYSIDVETIKLVSDVAQENGLSRKYAATVAIIESKGNSDVCYAGSRSNACGVYQFIPSTAKRYGLSDRFDPVASSEAFVEFTEDNREILQDALGRRPTDAEKYIAHQQGAAGAVALMSNPHERAIDVLYPVYLKQVKSEWKAKSIARKAIINNGGSSDMTAGEFVNLLISKYESISSQHARLFPS